MRIGINCLQVNPNYSGGVTSYTFGLLDGFVSLNSGHTFCLFVNEENKFLFEKYQKEHGFEMHVYKDYDSLLKRKFLWQAVKLKSKFLYSTLCKIFYASFSEDISKKVDVLYTSTTLLFPLHNKCKTVLSMHDIQQVHYPEFFTKIVNKDRYVTYNLSAENCDYMQASSHFIKNDFLAYFKTLTEENMVVIPEGVDIPLYKKEQDISYLDEKYNLPERFLFFPAQLWHHKNHITVLKALKILKDEHNFEPPLILTGAKDSASDNIFEYIENNQLNVKYLGVVPYSDIVSLFKRATFLITAVLYESSSIPILESAASGTPVIASKTPPNVEFLEHLKLNLFSPKDEKELAQLITKVWEDQNLIETQKEYNLKHIDAFAWSEVAKKYVAFFEKIA